MMTFGGAIEALRRGRVVSRATWPAGTWVGFTRALYRRTRSGHDVSWLPSEEDLFAEDWQLGG